MSINYININDKKNNSLINENIDMYIMGKNKKNKIKNTLKKKKMNMDINDSINVSNNEIIKIDDKKRKNILIIPKIFEYNLFKDSKYTAIELKQICRFYKLKVTGKKQILIDRIYKYLKQSFYVIKIQKLYRGYLIRQYLKLHGPIYNYKDRLKCVNDTDFLSLENIMKIELKNFFSFEEMGFVYGFHVESIYNLIKKSGHNVLNPYTRREINKNTIDNIRKLRRYNILLKFNNVNENKKEKICNMENLTEGQKFKIYANTVFQNIDELGHYSDTDWLLNLNKYELIRFIRELSDIWEYRASISQETKKNIYPNGNIFQDIRLQRLMISSFEEVRNICLKIIKRFIMSGINNENKNLGAIYVLGALTIVNTSAANALPWLYETFHL